MYQTLEITLCLRAVLVLAPNPPRDWTQSSKTQQGFEGMILRLLHSKAP